MIDLNDIYYDPKTGFISAPKLYKKAIELGLKVTLAQVKQFVSEQQVSELTKPIYKQKEFSTVYAPSVLSNIQIDLMIYDRYTFHKYKYILVVIDVYSRYVWAYPLTSRKFPIIMQKIKDLFKEVGNPTNINGDQEFNTHEMNDYAEANNITMYYSDADQLYKNAVVERFNRSLAGMIQKVRIGTKNYDWPKYLPELIKNYNSTYHSTIKELPIDVYKGYAESQQVHKIVKSDFKVNDLVRLIRKKKVFEKGDVSTYSKDTYVIHHIEKNRFFVKNIETQEVLKIGKKSYEMQKVFKIDKIEPSIQELEHENEVLERKIARLDKKESVDKTNIISEKRTTRSQTKLEKEKVIPEKRITRSMGKK